MQATFPKASFWPCCHSAGVHIKWWWNVLRRNTLSLYFHFCIVSSCSENKRDSSTDEFPELKRDGRLIFFRMFVLQGSSKIWVGLRGHITPIFRNVHRNEQTPWPSEDSDGYRDKVLWSWSQGPKIKTIKTRSCSGLAILQTYRLKSQIAHNLKIDFI